MIEKPLYLVVGKSATGKDTFVDTMCHQYGMTKVKSYTTRPPRGDDEDTHIFVTFTEFLGLSKRLVASTKYDGCFYGATIEQVQAADFYIVDPRGALQVLAAPWDELKERPIYLIYLEEELATRLQRLANRPNANELSIAERLLADVKNFDFSLSEELFSSDRLKGQYLLCWSGRYWCDQAAGLKYLTFEDFIKPNQVGKILSHYEISVRLDEDD